MKPLLVARNIEAIQSKTFRLSVSSLVANPGSITCVTGPNGCGKTTLLECLTGLTKPLRGTITIRGAPVCEGLRATKTQLGFVPDDEDWFIKELTAREYLDLVISVYTKAGVTAPLHKNYEQLAQDLSFNTFDQPLHQLSHGNKKKVQIIAALMHQPPVIVLDEIRNGLDPLAILATEKILLREARRGACIIAATHDLWWAERIATDVLLLQNGQIVVQDSLKNILRTYHHLENLFIAKTDKHSHENF
ncbi:MAG: ATP-binding cassette domain-containing protein [Candidatus Saccharibacteria bacterium]